jgi:uncharacterized protein (TIGR03083 family)
VPCDDRAVERSVEIEVWSMPRDVVGSGAVRRGHEAERASDRIANRAIMLDERRQLRQLLEGLSPDQWQQPSLCAGWSVRDVVAHLVAWDNVLLYRSRREHRAAGLRFSKLYLGSWCSMGQLNRRLARTTEGLTPEQLTRQFGADDDDVLSWLFDGSNPGAHLAEYVIHDQDIRLPLDLPREIPPDHLRVALDGVTKLPGVRISTLRRLRQARWQASDIDWGRGRGPVKSLPAAAVLMALAGREPLHR